MGVFVKIAKVREGLMKLSQKFLFLVLKIKKNGQDSKFDKLKF
jgi:hypothetical protein